MPDFIIKDEYTGKSITITDDDPNAAPPTQEEAAAIFAREKPTLADQGAQFVGDLSTEFYKQYVEPVSQITQGNIDQGAGNLAKSFAPSIGVAGYLANLYPPIAEATMGTKALLTGLSSISGDVIKRKILGEPITLGEEVKVGILGNSAMQAYALLGRVSQSPLARAGGYVMGGTVNAGIQGGVSASAEYAQKLLDEGRTPTRQELVSAAKVPAIVAGGFGTLSRVGEGVRTLSREEMAARSAFGTDNLPPGYRSPTMYAQGSSAGATGQTSVADFEQSLAAKWAKTTSPEVEGSEMASVLRPYAKVLDEAQIEQARLSQINLDAEVLRQEASAALDAARAKAAGGYDADVIVAQQKLEQASDNVFTANAATIAKNAAELEALKATDGTMLPATSMALFHRKVWQPMQVYLKNKENALFAKVDSTASFSGEEIADAITSGQAFTTSAKYDQGVMKALIDSRVTRKVVDGAKEATEYVQLNIADIRALRRDINNLVSPKMAGVGVGNNRILIEADNKISNVVIKKLQSIGPQAVQDYKEANKYYRNILEAEGNPNVKLLAATDPTDQSVQTFVNNMVAAGGDGSGYKGLIQYIDDVAAGNKTLAASMKGEALEIIKGALLNRNLSKIGDATSPSVDLESLYADVYKLSKGNNGFPIQSLGLGNLSQIRQLAELSKLAGLGTKLSQADFQTLISNPYIKGVLDNPRVGSLTVAFDQVANEIMAVKELQKSKMFGIIGATAKQRELYNKAKGHADKAKRSLADINEKVANLESSPLAVAFSGNKNFGINTEEGGRQFKAFISSLSDPAQYTEAQARTMMNAMGEIGDGSFLQQARLHLMTDTLQFLSSASDISKESVNWNKIAQFYGAGNEQQVKRIQMLVGADKWKQIESMIPRLNIVRQYNQAAGKTALASKAIGEVASTGRAIATGQPQGVSTGTFTKGISDLVARGHYKLAALLIDMPKVRMAMEAGANIDEAISKLGLQTAAMLYMNNPELPQQTKDIAGAKFTVSKSVPTSVKVPQSPTSRIMLGF
jgi:hypothetical protein